MGVMDAFACPSIRRTALTLAPTLTATLTGCLPRLASKCLGVTVLTLQRLALRGRLQQVKRMFVLRLLPVRRS